MHFAFGFNHHADKDGNSSDAKDPNNRLGYRKGGGIRLTHKSVKTHIHNQTYIHYKQSNPPLLLQHLDHVTRDLFRTLVSVEHLELLSSLVEFDDRHRLFAESVEPFL